MTSKPWLAPDLWLPGYRLRVDSVGHEILIQGNREGLISLARALTAST